MVSAGPAGSRAPLQTTFSLSFLWFVFGSVFGTQNPSKMLPEAASEKEREQKTQKREIAPPLNENPCFLGPTWSQNGPKMKPNACQEASENDVGKMVQKQYQQCSKNAPQHGPKTNQNHPKLRPTGQHRLPWAPEGPKVGPKGQK